MRLFAIGDTHLPSSRNKDMHRFGWLEHPEPLRENWDSLVNNDDVVIVAGDISWATRFQEAEIDLKFLNERPGKKIFIKGNHDYWWPDSFSKLKKQLAPYETIVACLHQCAHVIGPWVIAGSRLWTVPEAPPSPGGEMGDEDVNPKYVEREIKRLDASLVHANELIAASNKPLRKIVAVHFPPLYVNQIDTVFSKAIEQFAPQVCVYGHLHGPGIEAGFVGTHERTRYVLASCDAAKFAPVLLDDESKL